MHHPQAGKLPSPDQLMAPDRLEHDYYTRKPDVAEPGQLVSFGTSGHRGTPLDGTFTEAHILAITQAICDFRHMKGIAGPLFIGKDTHAASRPAERTALEVLAANGVVVQRQQGDRFTPTPALSRAILDWNQGGNRSVADGIGITPSHNPPADGGFKYNPPHGGPADTDATTWIQDRSNALLRAGNRDVKRTSYEAAQKAATTKDFDFVRPYLLALGAAIDFAVIREGGIRIAVDPLGGASLDYWEPLKAEYGIQLEVLNPVADPTFRFMTLDHDGVIRMDCSSKWAMQGVLARQKDFDVIFATDPDADRHGIVTRTHGLMDPNQYLAAAIHYLHTRRPAWPLSAAIGKTVVSSAFIDRVAQSVGRRLAEVPVGFKYFADGLHRGTYCFGGEESAGASFLKQDGRVWTTDKDGLLLGLLACELRARTELDPAQYFTHLCGLLGRTYYRRVDAKAKPEQKRVLKHVAVETLGLKELAGDQVGSVRTDAPENGAAIGGLKVTTDYGWFAARPSGTENIIKIYAESLRNPPHLRQIIREARGLIGHLSGDMEFASAVDDLPE